MLEHAHYRRLHVEVRNPHPQAAAAILVLNFFLGWTAIGWVIALVWALKQDVPVVIR